MTIDSHRTALPTEATRERKGSSWRRWIPLGLLAIGVALFFAFDLGRYLSLETLKEHRQALKAFVGANVFAAALAYAAIYVVVVALSLPVGAVLTLAGGFLFGAVLGTGLAVIAATIGATLLFLIARSTFGRVISTKAGPFVRRLEGGFADHALSYLLFLRLIPIFPFWVVNLVPSLIGVRLSVFVIGTFIGIIPVTGVYASFGAGLGSLFDAGEEISLKAILTPEIIVALVGLGVLALLPVGIKRWRHRNAQARHKE